MSTTRRLAVALLALTALAVVPLSALAEERSAVATRDGTTTTVGIEDDGNADFDDGAESRDTRERDDVGRDGQTDELTTDRPPVTDYQSDRAVRDRVVDRCRPNLVDKRRDCPDDEVRHDVNVRHLIWRLIQAHEWRALLRLLHRLGWF